MREYKFSVLMSVYYREEPEFLRLALESNLEKQSLIPDEMVLVCDGPLTEELDKTIAEFEKRYPDILKVFRLEKNGGLGNALNFGLERCSYDWVARSDSDDICHPDRFRLQLEFLENNPDVDIISSYIDEFDEDWTCPVHKKKMPTDHDGIVNMAKFRNPINHMSAMFRKKAVTDVGSYQHLPYVEDYYLWVRAIVNGARLANVPEYLVHARIGNGMVKRRGNRAYIGSWKTLNKYMLENKMIGTLSYCKNMIAVRVFVYMPVGMKEFVYKYIFRK